jgi:hypothetical protein
MCLCVGLITRPEESYRVWCVCVWLWRFNNEEALAHYGLLFHKIIIIIIIIIITKVTMIINVALGEM